MTDYVTAQPAAPAAAALATVAERTAAMMGQISNSRAPVPGLTWTAGEVAAHLVADLREYTEVIAGHGPRPALASAGATVVDLTEADNQRQLANYPERNLSRLATALTDAVPAFVAAAEAAPAEARVSTPFAMTVSPATIAAIVLGEQLMHGLDLARAAGQRWPMSAAEARLVIPGLMDLLPAYIRRDQTRGLSVRYELRFGDGLRYQLAIENETGRVTAPTGRPDCVITGGPVAFLLVAYGRVSHWHPLLRGKIRAGGRKPWLGLRFNHLTANP